MQLHPGDAGFTSPANRSGMASWSSLRLPGTNLDSHFPTVDDDRVTLLPSA
jgi:hypothetical protein